jgi:putative exosortase-associated protein (TIGR04073 family)
MFMEITMKQTLKMLLLLVTLFFITPYVANASSYPAKMGVKLGNGITNMVTGLGEIPKNIMIANRTDGPAYAATAGVMTGFLHMMGRTLCGATDLITFMIPTKPIVRPNFVWQNFKQETTYGGTWELLP